MARERRPSLSRVARVLAIGLFVAGSLITFPAGVPGMIGLWLAWHSIQLLCQRPGWLPLAACALLVVAKGTWPTLGLIVLALVAAASVAVGTRDRRSERSPGTSDALQNGGGPAAGARHGRLLLTGRLAALWLAWTAMLVDWNLGIHAPRGRTPVAGRAVRVVCLGDSLTAATTAGGYPALLEREGMLEAVNLGQDGITTTDALSRIEPLAALRPDVVVIELGGHDFLKGHGRAVAKANLEQLIAAARGKGAEVILVEIPRGFLFDPWYGLERQLAREHDLELLPDSTIRLFVLRSPFFPGARLAGPYLSDDGLHPNREGNRLLAARVGEVCERLVKNDAEELMSE